MNAAFDLRQGTGNIPCGFQTELHALTKLPVLVVYRLIDFQVQPTKQAVFRRWIAMPEVTHGNAGEVDIKRRHLKQIQQLRVKIQSQVGCESKLHPLAMKRFGQAIVRVVKLLLVLGLYVLKISSALTKVLSTMLSLPLLTTLLAEYTSQKLSKTVVLIHLSLLTLLSKTTVVDLHGLLFVLGLLLMSMEMSLILVLKLSLSLVLLWMM